MQHSSLFDIPPPIPFAFDGEAHQRRLSFDDGESDYEMHELVADDDNHSTMMDRSLPVLRWELTIPSGAIDGSSRENHGLYQHSNRDLSSNVLPSIASSFQTASYSQCDEHTQDQCRILAQYDDHQYTESVAHCVVDGFLRQTQFEDDPLFIPLVLQTAIFQYYHEESSVYLHFGYRLFLKQERQETVSGDALRTLIADNVSMLPFDRKLLVPVVTESVLNCLLKFGYIELSGFRTSFFSLFHKTREPAGDGSELTAGDHTVYRFNQLILEQFSKRDVARADGL